MKKYLLPLLTFLFQCAHAPKGNESALSAAGAEHNFRATRPQAGPEPELKVPVPEKRVLKNGLTVYALSKPGLPLVSATVVMRGGVAADSASQAGLAGFVSEILTYGTKKRSATQIAEEVESLGSSLQSWVDDDNNYLAFTSLTDNFSKVFDVAADVLMAPAFEAVEIERVRKMRLAYLDEEKVEPRATAVRLFRQVVFGKHPYGHTALGSRKVIQSLTAKDLRNFHVNHYTPTNSAVVVVGDLSAEAAFTLVEQQLGSWKVAGRNLQTATVLPKPTPALAIINKEEAPQSQIRIGHLGVARSDPDYFPLVICNAILGGLFSSRINMNLREDKGYTYGARSSFEFLRGTGSFYVGSGIRTDVTDLAIKEIFKEIERIRQEPVRDDELQDAKNRYALSLPGYFQSVDGISSMLAALYVHDLPLDYYKTMPEQISKVTATDVLRVAQKHLRPNEMSVIVVGDRKKIEAGLLSLGTLKPQYFDPEGNAIQ